MPFLNMVAFLQELKGETVSIELKNGSTVSGVVDNVDGNMNTHLSDVNIAVKGQNAVKEPHVTVRGGMIRYFKLASDYQKPLERAEKKQHHRIVVDDSFGKEREVHTWRASR
eukprot:CAMPEP_0176434954 /NCGR_PEP_ID=MMETSP0127-20121128/17010_1 /TAXON_ID=938130 /ORGANISM="Platyophrya macrostoma, Strain WH" /LENGTH=111 /DNA_ID=CAMNT_0017817841 /DNA_START=148 /DNA_END=484 /DNA_ORIENTATION=-